MTVFLTAVLIADAGGMIPECFFEKFVLMTFVVSLVCNLYV